MDIPAGRIVWFDYLTSEPAKAQTLFRALFGWTSQTVTMPITSGTYTMIVSDGKTIGGYGAPHPGTPTIRFSEPYARWLPHFQVASGHESAAKAKNLGAKMLREPTPFGEMTSKLAVAIDPNGQSFAMWQPPKVDGDPGWAGPPNTFCWAELYTSNTSSSVSFYKTIGGYTETKNPLPDGGTYHLLERDGAPRAGVRTPMQAIQPGWFAWVRVPDLAATAAKAQQLDATIVMPPANGMALLVDPWGCALGLAQA